MITINIRDAKVYFPSSNDVAAVKYEGDVDVRKVTVFVGPNGSGKSSFALTLYPLGSCSLANTWIAEIAAVGFVTVKWPLPLGAHARVKVNGADVEVYWVRDAKDVRSLMGGAPSVCDTANLPEELKQLCGLREDCKATCVSDHAHTRPSIYMLPSFKTSDNEADVILGKVGKVSSCVARSVCTTHCKGDGYVAFFYGPHLPLIRNGIMNLVHVYVSGKGKGNCVEVEEDYWKVALGFRENESVQLCVSDNDPSFGVHIRAEDESRPVWTLGDGQRAALALYVLVKTTREASERVKTVLVLDTPEAFMHPELAELTASAVVHELLDDENVHVVVVSQSYEYIKYLIAKSLLKLDKEDDYAVYVFDKVEEDVGERTSVVSVQKVEKAFKYISLGIDLRLIRSVI